MFLSDENYIYFLEKFGLYCSDCFETIAYCLLPNHFHFLVRVKPNQEDKEIVQSFSNFLNSYAKAFNKAMDRNGSLFQRKFKRKLIENDSYLSRIILYIHLNPIKHGLVKKTNDWKYSSFGAYYSDNHSKISKELGLGWFEGLSEFLKIHENSVEEYLPVEYQLDS
ncbi:transposase [Algoriphagus lutimaris]|uniref:transposase n=1 Tax=Algoriphagus lutimaris TaxID=613197 RepID=UPI001FAEE256|nr:transposase [Algoriphagus lutimaris]